VVVKRIRCHLCDSWAKTTFSSMIAKSQVWQRRNLSQKWDYRGRRVLIKVLIIIRIPQPWKTWDSSMCLRMMTTKSTRPTSHSVDLTRLHRKHNLLKYQWCVQKARVEVGKILLISKYHRAQIIYRWLIRPITAICPTLT
jgi:hypothetical protein